MSVELTTKVGAYLAKVDQWEDVAETGVPGLMAFGARTPMAIESCFYETIFCLNLQGQKEVQLGDQRFNYGAGTSVIASHDLLVRAEVTEASAETPYLSLAVFIDLGMIRSLAMEIAESSRSDMNPAAFDVCDASPNLIDAMARYFDLIENPDDARVLGPLIKKEIHYWLLTAPNGGMLQRLLHDSSHASRIAQAIAQIRSQPSSPISNAELAKSVGMSVSSFHEHFKAITQTTPLQYQKNMRLTEARQLLLEGGRTVLETALQVGYESPTQFSREYSRKFGIPPSQDQA